MTGRDHSIRQCELPNGLRIITQWLPAPGAVGVAVNYRAGFRGEPQGRSGMAHLFEHLMFQGSAKVGRGGHFAYVQHLGGTVSGNTFTDISDFHQLVPAGCEQRVLEMEADRMQTLAIDQERLDIQRRVVLEEINLKVEGAPYGGFPWTVLPEAVYSTWRNSHNGYGHRDELQAVTVDECRAFYEAMYAPGNAVVAVCGDIRPDQTLEQAAEIFGALADRGRPAVEPLTEQRAGERRTVHRTDRLATRPALAIGVPLQDPGDIDGYAASVVVSVWLTGNNHTWLREALRTHGAQGASVCGLFGPWLAADPDTFVFVAHHDEGHRDKVELLFDEGLERLAAADDDEIRSACSQAHTALVGQLDSPLGSARALARSTLLWGRPELVSSGIRRTATVPVERVRHAARALLQAHDRGYAELIPGRQQ